MGLHATRLLLAGLLLLPAAARGADVYSYVDADGVVHFSNAPTDRRYRRVTRTSDVAGVYRAPPRPAANGAPAGRGSAGYDPHIRTASEKYRIPEELLRAVMAVESNYNPRALSEKGAIGLMQLMPRTAEDMYVGDVWDPGQNIDGGARYLRQLANQYQGDVVKTLAAYNAGPEAVRRAGGAVPNIPETREYVRRVLALYQDYRAGR
jgi:soluble lytic murein transglycosylase-like protein